MDWEEAKDQILFSLPMILTNVAYYCIPLVSVMFAGHIGEVELAASNLANSWATVTGISFMLSVPKLEQKLLVSVPKTRIGWVHYELMRLKVGLSGALETLCGQGFGAKLYKILGVYLQSSCLISIFFSTLISILWIFTEPILVLLHQSPEIAKLSATYIRFLIPGLFAYGLLNNMLRFLQTQSIVVPLVLCSAVPLALHFGIAYFLVKQTSLAFVGAPLAASISLWISAIMLASYVLFNGKFKETWQGFSMEAFHHVFATLKLAVPSAGMVCLEYWAFELLVLLAGIMPDSEITTSLIALCVNTEAIAYMLTYGLSAAASTRVSNELGAGKIDRAKHAMGVTIKLSFVLALIVVLALGFGHNIWAGFFSNSPVIKKHFASMTPFLVISIILDSIQGVLSGVARGCGWQHFAMFINLGMFYLIGMPIAALLAFLVKLYAKVSSILDQCQTIGKLRNYPYPFLCWSGYLSRTFEVGGKDGWTLNPSENYNNWSGRLRFLINDTLHFKYDGGSDSVLVVNKDDYEGCDLSSPIVKLDGGDSSFKLDRSGPFYFVSGNKSNCDRGQKVTVVVLALRKRSPPGLPAATPPSPATTPPSPAATPPSPAATPPSTAATPPSPAVTPPSPTTLPPAPAVSPAVPPSSSPSPTAVSPGSSAPAAVSPSSPSPAAGAPGSPSPTADGPGSPLPDAGAPGLPGVPPALIPPGAAPGGGNSSSPGGATGQSPPPGSNNPAADVNSPPPPSPAAPPLSGGVTASLATMIFALWVIN
ncbi:hypothetical protein OSB04_015520 [Centaurea solstitialis]|uniref:Protein DETOXIFICATION n=1 Tax=Centaurea solstitialis TaxID=347529 RepID=A0AA38SZ84_9ASTR|nr:hypothetical protein OSB04_015520 [Centaurea solstitialis]